MQFPNVRRVLSVPILVIAISGAARATVQDFESFNDSDTLSTEISGLEFSNAIVLSATLSLNEIDFPPRSGSNVVSDNGGAITIKFGAAVASIGAYFTYGSGLTLTAYDSASNILGTDTSDFSSNLLSSPAPGSSVNEFLGVTSASGIRRIVIAGDSFGGSFVMDDLTYELAPVHPVPEPGALLLSGSLLGALWFVRRRGSGSRKNH